MKLLRNTFLFSILSLLFLSSCKKNSDSSSNNSPAGNYFKLNTDTRTLGQIPSTKITLSNAAYTGPNEWQLALGIKTDCYKIAGLNNDEFEIYVDIWDNQLLKSEYNISAGFSGGGSTPGPSGTASIGMRPFKIGGSGLTFFDAQSGKINVTKDASGKLKSVEFLNIPLSPYNGTAFTASGRFTVN